MIVWYLQGANVGDRGSGTGKVSRASALPTRPWDICGGRLLRGRRCANRHGGCCYRRIINLPKGVIVRVTQVHGVRGWVLVCYASVQINAWKSCHGSTFTVHSSMQNMRNDAMLGSFLLPGSYEYKIDYVQLRCLFTASVKVNLLKFFHSSYNCQMVS